MNAQQQGWDAEYKRSKMLSPSNVPQADVVRFVKWLKKEYRKRESRLELDTLQVLDLGSGTGRNAYYFAEQGANVVGLEFSEAALQVAQKTAAHGELSIEYRAQSIGAPYPLPDESIDIVLDVTSSNSLSDAERAIYLRESKRALKPSGHMFVRALSLEGDANAKELVKRFPGADSDSYVHPDLHITEKTFTRTSFSATYEPYFTVLNLERVEHYNVVAGRNYKRSYWIAYLQKPH